MGSQEKTFIMIKPDGVKRGLIGDIITRFERRGFHMQRAELIKPKIEVVKEHYAEHSDKPFFNDLINFILNGTVFAMVWEGKNVVSIARVMLGATNPANAAPGTIRGDYAIEVTQNICHASDSIESAEREIAIWFGHGINYEL